MFLRATTTLVMIACLAAACGGRTVVVSPRGPIPASGLAELRVDLCGLGYHQAPVYYLPSWKLDAGGAKPRPSTRASGSTTMGATRICSR
jgi:hypothetical protein